MLQLRLAVCRRLTRALLQGTLFGLYVVILLVHIVYLTISWDHALWAMSPKEKLLILYATNFTALFFARIILLVLIALLLLLLRSKPVDGAEQVLQWSSCFSRPKYPCQS